MKLKNLLPYLLPFFVMTALLTACIKKDLNDHEPVENDGTAPGVVTNVKVNNLSGAAIITYTLPEDADLQYVLAEYSINNTITRKAKASRYTDTIKVDGFNNAGEYAVRLYTVDKGENRSEPVEIKVNPTTPLFRLIAATLQLSDDFAGVNASFSNPGEDKIALVVLAKNHNDEWAPLETFYTGLKNGSYSVRGFDTVPVVIGAYIKDRWNNYSDTLFKTIHPLPERMLDKSKFKKLQLPDDQPSAWGWEMPSMWDGKLDGAGFHTLQGATPQPHRFTFDLGVIAKLSRYKLLQRIDGWEYRHGNPRYWTMWGTASTPDPSGSWNGWIKLMDCESIKPSGSAPGTATAEDRTYIMGTDGLGEEFTFPGSAPPVRFIRMEIKQNWSGTDFFHAMEITFWGNPQ